MNTLIKKILLVAMILPLTACFPPPFYPGAGYYQGGYGGRGAGYSNFSRPYGYGEGFHHFHGGGHGRR